MTHQKIYIRHYSLFTINNIVEAILSRYKIQLYSELKWILTIFLIFLNTSKENYQEYYNLF